MNRGARILPLHAALLVVVSAWGQDPQFSQFYAAPQYLNPAFTGNTYLNRVSLNYRLQWPGIQPGYETYAFSFDHHFAGSPSGLGGYVLRDKAGTQGLTFTTLAAAYSYEARLGRRKALRMGLRTGYTMRGMNPDGYLFADQVIRDNAARTIERGLVEQVNYLDMATGAVYYSEQFWTGVSFTHLNRPNQSLFLEGEARLPVRTSIHSGYRFAIDGQSYQRSDTRMTLATHLKMQGKWDQLDVGGYIEHDRISAGVWYRGLPVLKAYKPGYPNNEAIILMAGVETNAQLRFTYSYDITISQLTMASAGAHEISLAYEWPQRPKSRKYRLVPCPKF